MKKLTVAVVALILLLLCACGSKKTQNEGMPNPMTEYSSLKELGSACDVILPNILVSEATEEHYYCVDAGETKIAEYSFSLDGTVFSLRAAKNVKDDISGYYVNGKPLFEALAPALPGEPCNISGSDFKASRWFSDDTQYVLLAKDNGKFDAGRFATLSAQLEDFTTVSKN